MIQKCSSWKVFTQFAKNPTRPYQIRELSREIGLAATSIKLHLEELEKNNFIIQEKVGVYKAYKANFSDENFRFYKKLFNSMTLKECGIINELERQLSPDVIILFGSYSKGEDIENSDIDIFALAKEKKVDLRKFEKSLGRGIHLLFSEDLNKLPKELFNNILNGVILSGFIRWKI